MNRTTRTAEQWHEELTSLGFRATRDKSRYRQNGLSVETQRRWLTATAKTPNSRDPLNELLGKPGLWKVIDDGQGPRRQFHLPLAALAIESDLDVDGQEAPDPLEACLAWVSATSQDDLPVGWECPPRDEVESWLPAGGLTFRSGELVRQGSLVCEADRLALRMPLVTEVPRELPEARGAWLHELLRDGRNRWRMVRIGVEGPPGQQAVVAEVDLSGVPASAAEVCVKTGLDALRWVTFWLVRSAGLVADARVACRLVETGPERA